MEPPPPRTLTPPSKAEELYLALSELSKEGCGKKLTKREAETLRRWVSLHKKPGLTIRKCGNGATPYIAWVYLSGESR